MEQSWPEPAGQFNANAASKHAPIRERTRGGWKASTAGSGSFVYGFLAAYDRALRKAGNIFARRMSSVSNRQPHDNRILQGAATAYDASGSASHTDSLRTVQSETIMSTTAKILEKS